MALCVWLPQDVDLEDQSAIGGLLAAKGRVRSASKLLVRPATDALHGHGRSRYPGSGWFDRFGAGHSGLVGIAPITMILVALLATGTSMLLRSSLVGGFLVDLLSM